MRKPYALILCALLAACASRGSLQGQITATDPALESKLARAAEHSESGRALRDGVQALLAGDSALANRAFSRAIKLDPDNPQLHLLNAIAYHLGYARGTQINRDLAEAGYLVALRMDPNNVIASEMLGRLYLDSARYAEARRWLGRSLLLGESTAGIYQSFAVASYYSKDLPLALWAITQAENIDGKSPPVLRAGAMIRAASGEFDAAEARLQRYDALEPDPLLRRSLAQRVTQWHMALANIKSKEQARGPRQVEPLVVADATYGTTGKKIDAPASASGPIAPNWSDCGQASPSTSGSYGTSANTSGTASAADETVQLPALPSPCAGRPLPRMAVIDVAIIRSLDSSSTRKGINLLDTLSITLGANLLDYRRNWVNDPSGINSENSRQTNRAFSAFLSNAAGAGAATAATSGAGITYSLNIANAVDQANEVIARPSLLVLDRQPSTFFSGRVLSTVTPGSFLSARSDQSVGVNLSVTPTFIDDDTMLLAVKAGRSFFQDPGQLDLTQTISSGRNSASANVRIRFDETMVLSGLSEREIQENENGVPVLKDVPVVQYLFKSENTLNYNHSILVLLTPRRPETTEADSRDTAAQSEPAEIKEVRKNAYNSLKVTPNLHVVMASLDRKNLDSVGLYRQFRSGDLQAQVWHRPEGMQRILSEIASFLYY